MNTLTDKEKILNYIETLDQGDVKVLKSNKSIFPWMRSNYTYLTDSGVKEIVDIFPNSSSYNSLFQLLKSKINYVSFVCVVVFL